MPAQQVSITYFSDVLCIWAYIAELRIEEVKANFGDAVRFENRLCSIFGDTARKIPAQWGAQDGYERFNEHLRHAAGRFPEVKINADVWLKVRPASSASAHLAIKAAYLAEREGGEPGSADRALRAMRAAFFQNARDIADRAVQRSVCEASGVDTARMAALIENGAAFGALMSDYQDAEAMKVSGSPTFLLNEGRQKLYGNVGYRIIEANIQELLREPASGQASWC